MIKMHVHAYAHDDIMQVCMSARERERESLFPYYFVCMHVIKAS